MTATPDHDSCIAEAPEAFRPLLEELRATLARTLPDAEEIGAAGLKATKTGITFTARTPIPDSLVEKLALASRRAAEV